MLVWAGDSDVALYMPLLGDDGWQDHDKYPVLYAYPDTAHLLDRIECLLCSVLCDYLSAL